MDGLEVGLGAGRRRAGAALPWVGAEVPASLAAVLPTAGAGRPPVRSVVA